MSEKQIAELTPWHDGDVKPERAGMYQSDYLMSDTSTWYRYWDGNYWINGGPTIERAIGAISQGISNYQNWPWRGLAKEPK